MPEELDPPEEPGVSVVRSSPPRTVRPRGHKRRRARVRRLPPGGMGVTTTPPPASMPMLPTIAPPDLAWDAASVAPVDFLGSVPDAVALAHDDVVGESPDADPTLTADLTLTGGPTRTRRPNPTARRRPTWTPPRRGRGSYRPGTVPTALAVVVGALALAASVLAIVFALAWSNLSSKAGATTDAKNVAAEFLREFTNFQPNTIETDFNSLQRLSTGSFSRQATQYFGNSNLRRRLEDARAQSTGRIRNLYVQSLSGDRAQVYAVVDQTYTNAQIGQAGGAPVADVLRLQINLAQVGGPWKISGATVLSGPSSTTPAGSE